MAGRKCECGWGGVLDDYGKPIDPCPGGHTDPCEAEAVIGLRRVSEDEFVAHLCRPCAAKWISDGEWTGACECSGCGARHHRAGREADATVMLFGSAAYGEPNGFELVCGTCANLRTSGRGRRTRVRHLVPQVYGRPRGARRADEKEEDED